MKQPVQFTIRAILLIVLATFSLQVWGIVLLTQEDVDNFIAVYGSSETTGDLKIGEYQYNGLIHNLDGLSHLTSTGILLITGQNQLSDTFGLSNITSVNGYLYAGYNPGLTNIDGFANIEFVDGDLSIYDNPLLTDIDGLVSLTTVSGTIQISVPNITNLDALLSLNSVGGRFHLSSMPLITDLDGLRNISSVGGLLSLSSLPLVGDLSSLSHIESIGGLALNGLPLVTDLAGVTQFTELSILSIGGLGVTNLDAFSNLITLRNDQTTGALVIGNNANLQNVNGLSNLRNNGAIDVLDISDNPVLENVDALSGINGDEVGVERFFIQRNLNLSNVNGFSNVSGIPGHLTIYENPSLLNIDGLSALTDIGKHLNISENNSIADVNGLFNLNNIGGGLYLLRNNSLTSCSALALLLGWPDGPPNDNIAGEIRVENNASGCNSVEDILATVFEPTAPSITSSEANSGQATLTFSPSSTTDNFWSITGYHAQCLTEDQSVFENSTVMGIPDLGSVDSYLTVSGVLWKNAAGLNIPVNITHPRTRHLTLTLTSPSRTSVMLWNEAVGTGTDLVGTFPTTLEPAESLGAFDGEDFNGEWQLTVADGVVTQTGTLNSWGITFRDKVTATSVDSPIILTGLTDSQPYSCAVSAITGLGIGPASNTVLLTPTPDLIFDNGFEGDAITQ